MSVPVYTSEELATRIAEGSVDTNRLAATVHKLLALEETVTALAEWTNRQIQTQGQTAEPEAKGRKR